MRVTTLYNQMEQTAELMQSESRVQQTQQEVSTGLKVQQPSDAPSQIGQILQVQAGIAETQTRQSDITAALPVAQAGESALSQLSSTLQSIQSLALQASSSATQTSSSLAALANQITTAVSSVGSLIATKYNGAYLFSGTASTTPPLSAGTPATYQGTTTPLQVTLPGDQSFSISVTGDQILNSSGGTDLMQNLTTLAQDVQNGNATGISSDLTRLQSDMTNIDRLGGDLGSRVQYLNSAQSQLQTQLTNLQQQQSSLQNVDIAQAVVDEQTAVTAQQAALTAFSQTSNLSLVNYLR